MPEKLRLLVDENIPFAREAFASVGEVTLIAGSAVTPQLVRKTDVLLVRSVTKVTDELLDGSPLRFVGSATIGTDHVDQEALAARGIPFAHAPGCNADSVVEYVLAAIYSLAERRGETLAGRTVGIIGHGNIGSRLTQRLPALGFKVLVNDPPLEEIAHAAGVSHNYVPLDEVLSSSDIITLHVPYQKTGRHKTHHLLDAKRIEQLKPEAWIINASRGAVVDNKALLRDLKSGLPRGAVLDVFENEPTPSPELVRRCDIATPHIAGYSYDGKVMGTLMLYDALIETLKVTGSWDKVEALRPGDTDRLEILPPDARLSDQRRIRELIKSMYAIEADDERFRTYADLPPERHAGYFHDLRKSYPRRRSFQRHLLPKEAIPEHLLKAVRDGLRVTLV